MLSALDPGQPPRQWRPRPVNIPVDAEGNVMMENDEEKEAEQDREDAKEES